MNANHGWVSTAAAAAAASSSTTTEGAAAGLMTQQMLHGLHAGNGGTGLFFFPLSVGRDWRTRHISLMHLPNKRVVWD